ncbi:MAG: peptidylprolyl isomerase [Nitrospiraceae bacterium]
MTGEARGMVDVEGARGGTRYRAAGRWCLVVALGSLVLLPAARLTGCNPGSLESPVVVFVNGRPITQSEFEYRWSQLPESMQARYRQGGGKRKFLDDLIMRELLLQEARKRGLDQTADFRERMERFKEQAVLDELTNQAVNATVEITNDELDSYYASHSAELLATGQVRAAQIVVETASQARDLKRRLDQGGDFAKLARRYSIDEDSRENGGDLGLYRRGRADRAVEAVLFTLRPGTVSEPIKTESGFYLIKVISREPGEPLSGHALRDRLRQEMSAETRRKRFEEFLSKLKSTARIRMAEASRSVNEDTGPLRRVPTP